MRGSTLSPRFTVSHRLKECWGRWEVHDDRLRIYGTKRPGRFREIPLLWMPVKPTLKREGFKTALQRNRGLYSFALPRSASAVPAGLY